jgi:ribosome-associated translation inhibitor RaiA
MIFLKTENAHKNHNKTVEIMIHSAGKDIFASTRSEKFEIALQKSVAALKSQIRKTKCLVLKKVDTDLISKIH